MRHQVHIRVLFFIQVQLHQPLLRCCFLPDLLEDGCKRSITGSTHLHQIGTISNCSRHHAADRTKCNYYPDNIAPLTAEEVINKCPLIVSESEQNLKPTLDRSPKATLAAEGRLLGWFWIPALSGIFDWAAALPWCLWLPATL